MVEGVIVGEPDGRDTYANLRVEADRLIITDPRYDPRLADTPDAVEPVQNLATRHLGQHTHGSPLCQPA